ncbi:MAG TPA: response regulator [Methanospirillum sp.]|nr:response regulator [Methanospirillum sp.]
MISILLVDDEPVLLDLGSFYLTQREHFSVDTAENGLEALKQLEKRPYQIIVSDYDMPCMNGIELLREVKSKHPNQPFVIFTGKGREEVVIEALNLGVDFYLQKGGETKSQYAELAHKCRRAVERRQAQDQIRHLARLYSLLSRVNKAVYQIRDRNLLLQEVCQIATQEGGFKAAAITMVHPVTTIPELISCTTSTDLAVEDITAFVSPHSVPTIDSLNEDLFHICSDNRSYPHDGEYGKKLVSSGFLSSASFPLKIGEHLIGAFTLHVDEAGFFSEEEVLLLMEITENLSIAFELMEQEKEKEHFAERLGIVQSSIECADEAYFLLDEKGTILYANHAGYAEAEKNKVLTSHDDLKNLTITDIGILDNDLLDQVLSEPWTANGFRSVTMKRCTPGIVHHITEYLMVRKFRYEDATYIIVQVRETGPVLP